MSSGENSVEFICDRLNRQESRALNLHKISNFERKHFFINLGIQDLSKSDAAPGIFQFNEWI